jgi:hypothetical protein
LIMAIRMGNVRLKESGTAVLPFQPPQFGGYVC